MCSCCPGLFNDSEISAVSVRNPFDYSLAAAGRTTYVFDANGNQQIVKNPDGTRVTTTWDFENQPTQYNQPTNTTYPVVTMAYNADNQRVQKQA